MKISDLIKQSQDRFEKEFVMALEPKGVRAVQCLAEDLGLFLATEIRNAIDVFRKETSIEMCSNDDTDFEVGHDTSLAEVARKQDEFLRE